jgi:hypothetical protein
VDQLVRNAVQLRLNKSQSDIANSMSEAIAKSFQQFQSLAAADLSSQKLSELTQAIEAEVWAQIESENWIQRFRGRDILRYFVTEYGEEIKYESLRNLIISKMRDAEYQPIEMGQILHKIIQDRPGR